MVSNQQRKYRRRAITKWRKGFKTVCGYLPGGFDVVTFQTGFNMGWNAHKKKVNDERMDVEG